MQWMQDPSQSSVENLNNVRGDASRHFRNKKKAYLKANTEEPKTNFRIKMYWVIIDFRRGTSLELI